ncbi:FAD/NAD-P-binding domain-containing protein [Panus rudis PR-1116 ss-1]|nr:FAD/NAD-P-binding domain-containing protein [Panus rudis PR-1116 ss-1]
MSPSATKDFQVAIVGGGIVGLTLAIALQREGIPVQIYEAAEAFSEVGAAIGLTPYALEILRRLNVLPDILHKVPGRTVPPIYRKADKDNQPILELTTDDASNGIDFQRTVAHRAVVLDALVKHVDPATVHFSKRATSASVSPNGRPVVHFQDGTSVETDVLIGTDGIRSKVRPYVTGTEESPVKFSNATSYRGLVASETLKAAGVKLDVEKRPQILIGKGKHFILVPFNEGKMVNVAAIATDRSAPFGERLPLGGKWLIDANHDEIIEQVSEYGPESDLFKVMQLLNGPNKLPIHLLYPVLESYARGRVALAGDSAHAMLPFLASGASVGIEDAYLLAQILSHPKVNKSNVESALQLYSRLRVPRDTEVWQASSAAGDVFQGYGPAGDTPAGIREDIQKLLEGDYKRYAQGFDQGVGIAAALAALEQK